MEKRPFAVIGLSHLGLAPKDPQKARDFLQNVLGLPLTGEDHVVEQKVFTAMYTLPLSQARLEVLEEAEQGGPIGNFIEKRGGGIHHLALKVDDLERALAYLIEKNIPLIDDKPRMGAHGSKVAFIHPKAAGGLLVELVHEA